jgi:hypothetical protein
LRHKKESETERRYAMGKAIKVTLVIDDVTGETMSVECEGQTIASKDASEVIGMPKDRFYVVDKPNTICCIIHGGKEYCWC